ncbi:MAG TPA: GTPase [Gemmataceae bacterium]|nr:GTPase [Gemmataceae bacterium]
MLERLRRWWGNDDNDQALFHSKLEELRRHNPAPIFWLFGKTQSGKTTLVKFLTGADDAEVGHGFQPCTRFSRYYEFPSADAPVLRFLDTRGVDEPGYDPGVDLEKFGQTAHVVIVTVKALDFAQENVVHHLRRIREANPSRPILLVLTCLHEAYPQQQHPPYPFRLFAANETITPTSGQSQENLQRCLEMQRQRFADWVDYVLPLDITKPEEGFEQPNYGGDFLQEALVKLLPEAQRQTLQAFETAVNSLKEIHARRGLPIIVGHTVLAASAGAIPIPFVSLLLLPGIQRRMVVDLANEYGRPTSGEQFQTTATELGLGMLRKQAGRELLKFIPSIGIVAGAAHAGAATYALGKAFCYFDAGLVHGTIPNPEDLRNYYREQLERADSQWKKNEAAARLAEVPSGLPPKNNISEHP